MNSCLNVVEYNEIKKILYELLGDDDCVKYCIEIIRKNEDLENIQYYNQRYDKKYKNKFIGHTNFSNEYFLKELMEYPNYTKKLYLNHFYKNEKDKLSMYQLDLIDINNYPEVYANYKLGWYPKNNWKKKINGKIGFKIQLPSPNRLFSSNSYSVLITLYKINEIISREILSNDDLLNLDLILKYEQNLEYLTGNNLYNSVKKSKQNRLNKLNPILKNILDIKF